MFFNTSAVVLAIIWKEITYLFQNSSEKAKFDDCMVHDFKGGFLSEKLSLFFQILKMLEQINIKKLLHLTWKVCIQWFCSVFYFILMMPGLFILTLDANLTFVLMLLSVWYLFYFTVSFVFFKDVRTVISLAMARVWNKVGRN